MRRLRRWGRSEARGADVEVDKPTGDEGHTGQKVVVAKLAKSDDVV